MTAIPHLLDLICEQHVTQAHIGETVNVQACLEAMVAIENIGDTHLKLALLHVMLRMIETFLLADREMLDIARYPELYLGKADDVIAKRIVTLLGVNPPASLVSYLRKCLTGHAARSGEKATISPNQVRELFRQIGIRHSRKELRCSVCGYHFRIQDVGIDRHDLAIAEGLNFADDFDPGRLNDDLKPQRYSRLEIDHVVPEEGLGWSGVDNYQVACQFCNTGRLIFRRSLEPLSTMMAGALSAFPASREHRLTRQVIVVSALRNSGFRCSVCLESIENRELTARLRPEGEPARMWCVPWNLEVTCYRCWDT